MLQGFLSGQKTLAAQPISNNPLCRSGSFSKVPQGIDCSSTDVGRYGGCDLEEAKMWLAGDPMDPDREIPTQTKWEREGW